MATAAEGARAVLLRGDDNVAVAARPIPKGFVARRSAAGRRGPRADRAGAQGRPGRHRGRASRSGSTARSSGSPRSRSRPGRWVHVHNVKADLFERDYAYASEPPPRPPATEPRTFPGYLRPDGRVGTRNYVAVISTVNCSASTSRYIAERFRDGDWRRDFPNVDGVFAITHKGGCGDPVRGARPHQLERVLAGFANHPNVAAYVLVGLGCEVSFAQHLVEVARPGHARRREAERRRRTRDGPAAGAQHPGAGRDHQDGRGGRRRRSTSSCPRPTPGPGPSSRPRRSAWRWSAAGRTATRASRPTRRSGSRPTWSSPRGGRPSSARRPRSTAPSTC